MDSSQKVSKPKYMMIKEDIMNKIIHGDYLPGDRLPSEKQLAEKHSVSKITSKRALNELEEDGYITRIKGSGSFVTDYSTNKVVSPTKSKIIAMVLPFSTNTGGSMELLGGVEEIAKKHDYYISMENSHASREKEREILLNLIEDGIDGIIFYPTYSAENFDLIKKLVTENFPFVIIDKRINEILVDNVYVDSYGASYAMTQHLIDSGHENIAFVCSSYIDIKSSNRQRFNGYCDALTKNGIRIDLDKIIYHQSAQETLELDDGKRKFYESVIDRVLSEQNITALQATADVEAVELIRLATLKGIHVPEKLTIVGFDDLKMASYITPSLTTVHQDFAKMGRTAADLIIRRIKQPKRKPETHVLPASLVLRQSSQNKRLNHE